MTNRARSLLAHLFFRAARISRNRTLQAIKRRGPNSAAAQRWLRFGDFLRRLADRYSSPLGILLVLCAVRAMQIAAAAILCGPILVAAAPVVISASL